MSEQSAEILVADGEAEAMRRARTRERRFALAAGTLAIVVLLGGLAVIAPWRPPDRVRQLAVSPTPTPISDLSQVPEGVQWGHVWSLANGVSVFRPTWLPPAADGYATGFSVGGGTGGLDGYRFWYYANEAHPTGRVVRSIELMAAREGRSLGLTALDSTAAITTVRGEPAQIVGTDIVPLWELSWSGLGYEYGVQVVGYSRDDAVRIANALSRVIDDAGNVGP